MLRKSPRTLVSRMQLSPFRPLRQLAPRTIASLRSTLQSKQSQLKQRSPLQRPIGSTQLLQRKLSAAPIQKHTTNCPEVKQLHAAIRKGEMDDAIKMLVAAKDAGKTLASATDPDGFNALHLAAKYGTHSLLTWMIMALEDKMYQSTKQVTRWGSLPIQLSQQNTQLDRSPNYIGDKFERLLFDYTRRHRDAKSLSEQLSEDKIVATSTIQRARENLSLSVRAINKTRQLFIKSSTHHSNNHLSTEELNDIAKQIEVLRADPNLSLHAARADAGKYHTRLVQKSAAAGVGNCEEYAHLAVHHLIKMGLNRSAEVYAIENGDHWFVVFDRDLKSDPSDYKTWGENAVVCDAWSGETFPASEIPTRLKAHEFLCRKHETTGEMTLANVAVEFNPAFHKLRPYYQFIPTQTADAVTFAVKRIEPEPVDPEEEVVNLFLRRFG